MERLLEYCKATTKEIESSFVLNFARTELQKFNGRVDKSQGRILNFLKRHGRKINESENNTKKDDNDWGEKQVDAISGKNEEKNGCEDDDGHFVPRKLLQFKVEKFKNENDGVLGIRKSTKKFRAPVIPKNTHSTQEIADNGSRRVIRKSTKTFRAPDPKSTGSTPAEYLETAVKERSVVEQRDGPVDAFFKIKMMLQENQVNLMLIQKELLTKMNERKVYDQIRRLGYTDLMTCQLEKPVEDGDLLPRGLFMFGVDTFKCTAKPAGNELNVREQERNIKLDDGSQSPSLLVTCATDVTRENVLTPNDKMENTRGIVLGNIHVELLTAVKERSVVEQRDGPVDAFFKIKRKIRARRNPDVAKRITMMLQENHVNQMLIQKELLMKVKEKEERYRAKKEIQEELLTKMNERKVYDQIRRLGYTDLMVSY
uniref:Uncharacterized protein n=1 Tax=Magallana gigas TaxID=29159 RepID=K1R3S6_MAGGI